MSARSEAIQQGINDAYEGTPDHDKQLAMEFIIKYAKKNRFFDGGEILAAWRKTKNPAAMKDWRNRWGGMIMAAKGAGIMKKVGYQEPKSVQSHTGILVKWESKIYSKR